MEIITKKDERIVDFFSCLEQIRFEFDDIFKEYTPPFQGERYITDKSLSEVLNISRRTLQEYRNQGIISYISLGGKILYRESDIEEMLENHYQKAWNY